MMEKNNVLDKCNALFGDYYLLSEYRSQLMGFAMLWVMLFHAYHFDFDIAWLDFFKSYGFGSVDIFILLSGLGIYYSISTREKEKFSQYFFRRCGRTLPAFWLIVGSYSIWLVLHGRISWANVAWNLSTLYYWFDIPNSFNWYFPVIIAFYAIAPLWAKVLQRCNSREVLTALTFPVSFLIYRISIVLSLNHTNWFLYRIPTFAMGMLIGSYIIEKKRLTTKHMAVWLITVLIGIVVAVLRVKGVFSISICYVLNCFLVPFSLIIANILSKIKFKLFNNTLKMIGESSLEIYLINVIITREYDLLEPLFRVDYRHITYYFVIYVINIATGILLHRYIFSSFTKNNLLRHTQDGN